jgi:hypothetical protein
MIQELKTIFLRDLAALRQEVERYPDDAALWRELPGIANPGGSLALHLAGNLQFFVGEQVGHSGYVRNRDREFTVRDLPRAKVLQEIDAAAKAVEDALSAADPAILKEEFPSAMGGKRMETGLFLLSLVAHLGYHLGQINYHRRMIG